MSRGMLTRKWRFYIRSAVCSGLVVLLLSLAIFSTRADQFFSPRISKSSVDSLARVITPGWAAIPHAYLQEHLGNLSFYRWSQGNLADPAKKYLSRTFKKHEKFTIYGSFNSSSTECEAGPQREISNVLVDEKRDLPFDLKDFLTELLDESDNQRGAYFHEFAPILDIHLRSQLLSDTTGLFWFRFSGSSVWLKDYGVHMLTSRLVFAESRDRQKPTLSLTVAQLFDINWKELKNTILIFPTEAHKDPTAPVFQCGENNFSSLKFPSLLPIPFSHDRGRSSKYFGTEDPRSFLIINPDGHEEPAVAFNSIQLGDQEDNDYRSMFVSLPFQWQKGKTIRDPKSDNIWYSRTKELRVEGEVREKVSKNWVPMVSDRLRSLNFGSDYDILFVTQLTSLTIIKCTLYGDKVCVKEFETHGNIGELRGGTPFISLNNVLKATSSTLAEKFLPPGREVFVGLARAQLLNCGCGVAFYRPNLVTIVSESKLDPINNLLPAHGTYGYRIAQVSTSLSLEVQLSEWDLASNGDVCARLNVLMPNGIEGWHINKIGISRGKLAADDVMSLLISTMDNTVSVINVKGLLGAILEDYSLFFNPTLPESSERFIDGMGTEYNEKASDCALKGSREFCKIYGQKAFPSGVSAAELSLLFEQERQQVQNFEKVFAEF